MNRTTFALFVPALLAACASQPSAPVAPLPDNLRPAAGEVTLITLAARGVQIYECRAKKDKPDATEWAFVAPEAELFDAQGRLVGKHYAGPHWESTDGSKIVGSVKARADSPQWGAIPWLLLSAKSVGPAGAFAKATEVQRLNTAGGAAPAEGCSSAALGATARVPYTADYVLLGTP
jgi:hypothetical protein